MITRRFTSKDLPGQRLITESTIEALQESGGSGTNDQIRAYVIRKFHISEELARVTFDGDSNTNVLEYRLREARTKLRKQEFVLNQSKGRWALTVEGGDEVDIQTASSQVNVRPVSESSGIPSETINLNDSMTEAPVIAKVGGYQGDLNKFLEAYNYQPGLTHKLDDIGDRSFNQDSINEIVLWKTDRYARLDPAVIHSLNELVLLRNGEHRRGQHTLEALLETRGVDLAMASTFLRFRNPQVFPIIDRRAYRAVYGRRLRLYQASSKDRKNSGVFQVHR